MSDSWTSFTQFTLLSEKPQTDIWVRGGLTKRQVTSRPDQLWPELWSKLIRNAKLREKQKWAIEKPKLYNARSLRGIYFIDLEDKEFKETIKNARKKLEHQWLPECLARHAGKASMVRPVARLMISSLSLHVSWKPVNPQECVWKNLYQNIMRTSSAGRGDNSLQHYNLVHNFIPMPPAMKIPAAKAAVDKEWEKLEKIPSWDNKSPKQIRGDR